MSERIEMWRAKGGKIFATEAEALKHEREMSAMDTLDEIYFDGIIECASDIISFLIAHKKFILEYYGIEN